jgi:hypothetical protein
MNVHAGQAPPPLAEKIGLEGARTIPGRPEHGGNCDIKNLSRGSKVYLPVHVKGAKFSVGDLHFSQGDGEISFCGAIEMAGVITIKFKVIKNGVANLGCVSPIYIPGPVEPQFGLGRYIYFEGFSVDEEGRQRTSSHIHTHILSHPYLSPTFPSSPAPFFPFTKAHTLTRQIPHTQTTWTSPSPTAKPACAPSNTSAASATQTTSRISSCPARPCRHTQRVRDAGPADGHFRL